MVHVSASAPWKPSQFSKREVTEKVRQDDSELDPTVGAGVWVVYVIKTDRSLMVDRKLVLAPAKIQHTPSSIDKKNMVSLTISLALSIYLSIYLSAHLPTYLPVYRSIHLSI